MTFIPSLTAEISTSNSTSSTLTSSQTFTGTSNDVLEYGSISVTSYSNVDSSLSGLSVEFSSDGSNWDITFKRSCVGGVAFSESFPVMNKYFRVLYTNGSTNQSQFRLQCIKLPHISYVTKETIDNVSKDITYTCNVVKHNDGSFKVPITYYDSMSVNIESPSTAFGEISVAKQIPLIELTFPYNINSDIVNSTTSGSGNIYAMNRKARITSGSTSNSVARMTSCSVLRYSSGVGMCVRFSGIFSTPISTGSQYIGIGDADNGFFFGYTGTTFGINHRCSSGDMITNQSSWSRDKMDGTGLTGHVLDPSKGNVYQILYQWLGFGCIKFFVEEPTLGFILIHQIDYSGTSTSVSIDNPSLPLCVEVKNGGTSSEIYAETASMSGILQGDIIDNIGIVNSVGNVKTIDNNIEIPILTIRNKSTFNSVNNKTLVKVQILDIATEGNKSVTFKVYLNGTISGASYTDINTINSVIDYDISGTSISGGRLIYTFFMKNSDSRHINVSNYMPYINPGELITITAKTSNKTNENSVAMSWIERL